MVRPRSHVEDEAGPPEAPRHRPMRPAVVHVLPGSRISGAENVVCDLVRMLPDRGFDVSVVVLEAGEGELGQRLRETGTPCAALGVSRRRIGRAAARLARQVPAGPPVILHGHMIHAALASRLAVRRLSPADRRRVAVVTTMHNVDRRAVPWRFFLDRLTAGLCAREICVSEAVARFQVRRTGLRPDFFRVIRNGVDTERFRPAEDGEGGSERLVASLGRLTPQKDFPTLLRAWREVEARDSGARLVIGGRGPDWGRLSRLVRRLELSRVTLPGFVEDPVALLRRASVYVQPSAWEGFGLAVAEAMAAGVPVIVSDADGLPEIVTDGVEGLVVPRRRPDALAEAILALLRDAERRRTLGLAGRRRAVAELSADRMAEEHAALYREVLAGLR